MIGNIQALRAAAALLVVLHHLQGVLAPAGIARIWFMPGATGVDVFFVISGFIMVHTMARHPLGAADFAINRVIRVVPLYWLFTLAIAAVFVGWPAAFPGWVTPGKLVRSLLFIPYGDRTSLAFPVLFVGWSLDFEMAFYALFTAAILVAGPRLGRIVALVIAVLVALVAIGRLLHPTRAVARMLTDPINLEFAMGMALAALHRTGRAPPRRACWALLALGFAALFAASVLVDPHRRGIAYGLPSLAAVAGAIWLDGHGVRVVRRPVLLGGAASYALYLAHPLALLPFERLSAAHPGPVAAWGWAAAALGASLGLALFTHRFVELPLTDRLRRLARHRRMEVERIDPSATGLGNAAPPR